MLNIWTLKIRECLNVKNSHSFMPYHIVENTVNSANEGNSSVSDLQINIDIHKFKGESFGNLLTVCKCILKGWYNEPWPCSSTLSIMWNRILNKLRLKRSRHSLIELLNILIKQPVGQVVSGQCMWPVVNVIWHD